MELIRAALRHKQNLCARGGAEISRVRRCFNLEFLNGINGRDIGAIDQMRFDVSAIQREPIPVLATTAGVKRGPIVVDGGRIKAAKAVSRNSWAKLRQIEVVPTVERQLDHLGRSNYLADRGVSPLHKWGGALNGN